MKIKQGDAVKITKGVAKGYVGIVEDLPNGKRREGYAININGGRPVYTAKEFQPIRG